MFSPPTFAEPTIFDVQRPNVSVSATKLPSTSFHPFTTDTLSTTRYDQNHIVGGGPPYIGGPTNVPLLGTSSNSTVSLLQSFFEKQMRHESLPKFELDVFEGEPLKWPEWYGVVVVIQLCRWICECNTSSFSLLEKHELLSKVIGSLVYSF